MQDELCKLYWICDKYKPFNTVWFVTPILHSRMPRFFKKITGSEMTRNPDGYQGS